MKLNEKLMKLRKEKGLSQEEFGNEINVSRQAVSKWETGETKPDIEKIQEIGKKFNISYNYLLDDELVEDVKPKITVKKLNKKVLLKILLIIVLIYLLICLYKFIAFYRFYLIANSFSEDNYWMSTDYSFSNELTESFKISSHIEKNGNIIIEKYYNFEEENFPKDSYGNILPYSISYTDLDEKIHYVLNYQNDTNTYFYHKDTYSSKEENEFFSNSAQNLIKENTLSYIPSTLKDIFIASINPMFSVSIFNRTITAYSPAYSAKQKITLTEDYLIEVSYLKTDFNGSSYVRFSYDYVPGHFKNKELENPLETYKDMIVYED